MSHGRAATRLGMAMIALGLLAGCKTWRPATLPPERLIVEEQPSSVRITAASGQTLTLNHPILVGDSIVGPLAPSPGTTLPPPRPGVVASEVRGIEVPEFSPGRTIALAVGMVVVASGWAGLVAGSGGQPPPNVPEPKFSFSILDGIEWLLGGRW